MDLINNWSRRPEAFAPDALVRGECMVTGFYFGRVLSVGPKTYRIRWDTGRTARITKGDPMIFARVV